jgi:hypothetical protein
MIRATLLLTVASSVLAWLAMAGIGAAQNTAPELSTLEVIQYVSSGQPADHARLRDHFVALADHYTADAARHAAMMRTFAGNPNRTSGENLTVYCRRVRLPGLTPTRRWRKPTGAAPIAAAVIPPCISTAWLDCLAKPRRKRGRRRSITVRPPADGTIAHRITGRRRPARANAAGFVCRPPCPDRGES